MRGTLSSFICRWRIVDPQHFCNTPNERSVEQPTKTTRRRKTISVSTYCLLLSVAGRVLVLVCVITEQVVSTNETHDKRSPGRNSRYSGHRTRECSMNLHDAVVVFVFQQTHNGEDTQQQQNGNETGENWEKREKKQQNIGEKQHKTHLETEKSRWASFWWRIFFFFCRLRTNFGTEGVWLGLYCLEL